MNAPYVMGLSSMVVALASAYYPSCDVTLRDQLLPYCDDTLIKERVLELKTTNPIYRPVIQGSCPLIEAHPALAQSLSFIRLGSFPTPIKHLETLSRTTGHSIFIKDDGVSGAHVDGTKLYGGNKVRKLEFLLADARARGAKEVFTFGAAGSNHALATSIYAQQLGFRTTCLLLPQHNSRNVRANLLAHAAYGSTLRYYPSREMRNQAVITHSLDALVSNGTLPYIIPTGGSSVIGALGFVNAAFELAQQIKDGLPCPDIVYIALGSYGSYAGLVVGIELLGLPCQVIGVAIEPVDDRLFLEQSIVLLLNAIRSKLIQSDPSIQLKQFDSSSLNIIYSAAGDDYGLFTLEGMQTLHRAQRDDICLDGTYTAKACSGMLDDLSKRPEQLTVLFWHTFSAQNTRIDPSSVDFHDLPRGLHDYFIQDVQPLDRS